MADQHYIHVRRDRRSSPTSAGQRGAQERAALEAGARRYCWDLHGCDEQTRSGCYAYFIGQNCWDLWAARPAERKYCCQRVADCNECSIVQAKFPGQVLPVYIPVTHTVPSVKRPAIEPQVARCRYFAIEGLPTIPADSRSIRALIKSLSREERDVFRCRLRRVHLEWGYVHDLCLSRHFSQCIFLDEKDSVSMGQKLNAL